ncbi:MAG: serine hydrolase, partial [Rhizomicrobium sp.]
QRATSGATAGRSFSLAILALATILATCLGSEPAFARHHAARHAPARTDWSNVSLTDPSKDAALIEDGVSGRILYARNARALRHPASLTKLMTLYMLFDSMKRGQTTLRTMMPVSEHAASQHPTKLYVHPGDSIDVETAIKAVVVLSANDVAVVIAEYLGGTEDHFGEMMTQKARQLGMNDTFYHNASGLPDDRQITTAYDLGLLARHLAYDFPQYFHYWSTSAFAYRGRYYRGHDNLLGKYPGTDGMKTGYTQGSGFNLVSSVSRGNSQIIGVVMGGRTAHMRDMEMMRLLDATYQRVAQDPSLIAHRVIPWEAVAENDASGVTASIPTGQQLATYTNDPDDEDAAESRSDSGDAIGNLIARTAPPQPAIGAAQKPVAVPPPPVSTVVAGASGAIHLKAPPPPSIRPKPSPRQMLLASIAAPNLRPSSRAEALGEGDIGDAGTPIRAHPATNIAKSVASKGVRDWTIQIGAFGDAPSAKQQLAAYAERSMDVLGQAERIVVPFKSVDGKTLYRARFGPFVEAEARAVCQRMTERKQTCFATAGK